MTSTESDARLCGYMEQGQDAPPCWVPVAQPGDYACDRHLTPRFSVCVGCAQRAVRLCQHDGPHAAALCPDCEHKGAPGTGEHGPKDQPEGYGEPENDGVPQTPSAIERELTETVLLSLRRQGFVVTYEQAGQVVRDLATTTLLGIMSGIARQQAAQTGG